MVTIQYNTIQLLGPNCFQTLVVSLADLKPDVEYIYKCSARNAIGSSTFAQKSLTQLKAEFCRAGNWARCEGRTRLFVDRDCDFDRCPLGFVGVDLGFMFEKEKAARRHIATSEGFFCSPTPVHSAHLRRLSTYAYTVYARVRPSDRKD